MSTWKPCLPIRIRGSGSESMLNLIHFSSGLFQTENMSLHLIKKMSLMTDLALPQIVLTFSEKTSLNKAVYIIFLIIHTYVHILVKEKGIPTLLCRFSIMSREGIIRRIIISALIINYSGNYQLYRWETNYFYIGVCMYLF